MDANLTPAQLAEIDAALAQGNKIEAIKTYRLIAKCDLVDAKRWVEARADTLSASNPNAHLAKAAKGGCMSLIMAIILSLGAAVGAAVWVR